MRLDTTERELDLYLDAIDTWGRADQMDMAIEEAAELIVALQHYKRRRATVQELMDELVDVRIMLGQVERYLVGHLGVSPVSLEHFMDEKLDRLEQRLEAEHGDV